MTVSVVIAAGGTGGHVVPALAIADAIVRARPDARISFVGTARAVDRTLVEASGYRRHVTTVRPFTRDARGLLAPLSLLPATAQARRVLRSERASVALGMGGYASVPVIAAARLGRVPAVIHEANAIPGLANEIGARLTANIAVSFPDAVGAFGSRSPRLVGVPLRRSIATFERAALRDEAFRELGLEADRRTVLVFGGSLGASRINDAVVGLAARWRDRRDVQILHAAGATHAERVAAALGSSALVVRVRPFIERMELAYAAADVVVSRAGASTVAELAATGLPSILVPLPIARRREQHANARALGDGAVVIENEACTAERLASELDALLADEARLRAMSAEARAIARPDAADEMAAWVLELAGERRG